MIVYYTRSVQLVILVSHIFRYALEVQLDKMSHCWLRISCLSLFGLTIGVVMWKSVWAPTGWGLRLQWFTGGGDKRILPSCKSGPKHLTCHIRSPAKMDNNDNIFFWFTLRSSFWHERNCISRWICADVVIRKLPVANMRNWPLFTFRTFSTNNLIILINETTSQKRFLTSTLCAVLFVTFWWWLSSVIRIISWFL